MFQNLFPYISSLNFPSKSDKILIKSDIKFKKKNNEKCESK